MDGSAQHARPEARAATADVIVVEVEEGAGSAFVRIACYSEEEGPGLETIHPGRVHYAAGLALVIRTYRGPAGSVPGSGAATPLSRPRSRARGGRGR